MQTNKMGTPPGVGHRPGQPATAPLMRIPGRREPDPPLAFMASILYFAMHASLRREIVTVRGPADAHHASVSNDVRTSWACRENWRRAFGRRTRSQCAAFAYFFHIAGS